MYGEEDGVVLSPSPPSDDKKNPEEQPKTTKIRKSSSFISDELVTWVSPTNTQENT